jgi:hypothetical protein
MEICLGIGIVLGTICVALGVLVEFVTRMLPHEHQWSACNLWGVPSDPPPFCFVIGCIIGMLGVMWLLSLPIIILIGLLYLAAKSIAKVVQNYSVQKIEEEAI